MFRHLGGKITLLFPRVVYFLLYGTKTEQLEVCQIKAGSCIKQINVCAMRTSLPTDIELITRVDFCSVIYEINIQAFELK